MLCTLDDGLVGLDTAGHIIGLDGQDLLEGIGRAVGLQSPDFHFAETLAAELSLAAQRLLSDQGIGAGGTGVDLIVNQMMELQIVGIADRDQVIEGLAGTAVIQDGLAVLPEASQLQSLPDVLLVGAVEDGGGNMPAQSLGSIAQMNFQHLTDVHTGRHAQGVQHDVQGGAVGQEGHILLGQNPGNNTLVAVTAGHLIAHADLPLLGDDSTRTDLVTPGASSSEFSLVKTFTSTTMPDVAVRHLQRGIPDFSRLLAEDGPQQPLLRRSARSRPWG